MKILNFGSCNIDYVYTLDHIVKPGETETSDKMETFPGGKGLNQSIAVANAGAKIYHAGCIGNDAQILTDVLLKSGVDISYLKKADVKNGHAIIQVNAQGENSIFLYPGSNQMITDEFIDRVLSDFGKGDIILLQNEISGIKHIVDKAYEREMIIVLNPSPMNEKLLEIDLNKISYIILNEVEGEAISQKSEPGKILSYFKAKYPNVKVMLTLGSKGCIYMDSNEEIYQPIFETAVVDTTAAGDTFTGYFIAGIASGREYRDILKTASCAAAIAVSKKGAAPSIPMYNEVQKALKSMKEKKDKSDIVYQKIVCYLEENLSTATLSELAEVLCYSVVYTGNIVKKLFNKPFTEVLSDMRCEAAAKLLKDTEIPVDDIIKNVGYANGGFFRAAFKEKYGKNLLEYRKNAKEEIK